MVKKRKSAAETKLPANVGPVQPALPAGEPDSAPNPPAPPVPAPPVEDGKTVPIRSIGRLIELSEELLVSTDIIGRPIQWAFRGQSQKFGTLVPSFQRQFTNKYVGAAETIERRLIDAFREQYSSVGLQSSPDMPDPSRIATNFDLRCLSVMQHYEIPTRLLDWTTDFWTAVYFACAGDPKHTAELWYYDREVFSLQRSRTPKYSSLMSKSPTPPAEPPFLNMRHLDLVVELDFQITPRMDQQKAHHTVSSAVFSDHVQLIESLAQQVGFAGPHPVLQRILIDKSAKGNIVQYLADTGITASTIFPDVVGLGRFLRWQFESLRTRFL